MDIIELIETNKVKKVNAIIESRVAPNGSGYEMLKMTISIQGRESTWGLGLAKLKELYDALPTLVKEVEAHDQAKGPWVSKFEFAKKPNMKFDVKPMKMNQNHVCTLFLFTDEIKQFVSQHTKTYRQPAIKEVKVFDWVHDMDVVPMIALPCYPMQEGDTGEGLVPWQLSSKKVSNMLKYYIVNDEEGLVGDKCTEYDIDSWFELWTEKFPNEPYTYKGRKQDGTPFEILYTPEQMKAWVKYEKEISRFDRANR